MDFQNLDEYYEYLENDTNFQYLDLNTYKFITALRDRIEDESIKKLCSYELFCINFSIEAGKHIPTLELFDDNFDYIKVRANQVQNPKYKAKYNHLLWLSPQQHIDFAKEAIESYLLFLKNSSFLVDDNLECNSFGKYYKNLFVLSQKVNYKKDETITYFVSLLESEKLNSFTKSSMMKFIVENGKNIDTSIKQTFFDYSKDRIDSLSDRELENYLNLLVLLSQKLNISPNEFHEKLGDYHISQLDKEKNKGFIAHHYYINALEEYKKANNETKIEKTAVLLEQAKKTIDLKKVSFELEDEKYNTLFNQWWDSIKEKTTQLTENGNAKDIYGYLILDNLLPKAAVLNEEIKPVTFDLVSTMTFDINKNVTKNKSGGINPYSIHINNFSINHIWLIVSKGIKSGKISSESLIDYLKNNSWYGQDFTYIDSNDETQGFNWIELLSPSLQSFFAQIEIELNTNSNNPQGYILAIDSFVLKFEGLLREFSRMIGAPTIEIKENGTKERIGFDKLLDNEKVTALIPEDDIAFLKYLFTSKGINLRNNVAHCFFTTKNYAPAVMLLLIVALLRLGNFQIKG
jgi:hypothetical protein